MPPRKFLVDPRDPEGAILEEAAQVILEGGIVAIPTETFYALAADGLNPEAVSRVLEAKGRESSKPTGLLVADEAMLASVVKRVPRAAVKLMDRFWPGPLNLVFDAVASLPPGILGDRMGVSIRVPASLPALGLIRILDRPITATSANRTGEDPPQTADQTIETLGDFLEIVIDAGETRGGLPSTMVDVRGKRPILLRAGTIPWEDILACFA
jgi:L-threonylcarbamoyladenylate synthase